jgi:hypothetical protein
MVREIPLTQGYVALVDDEDYESVSQFNWHALITRHTVYARRWTRMPNRRIVYLHRMLVCPEGERLWVDHIDGDGLNNTRANLRSVTQAENSRNRRPQIRNQSGFKGVNRQGSNWRAAIQQENMYTHIGMFETAEQAAKAYDEAALEHFGEFAFLNFPKEVPL